VVWGGGVGGDIYIYQLAWHIFKGVGPYPLSTNIGLLKFLQSIKEAATCDFEFIRINLYFWYGGLYT